MEPKKQVSNAKKWLSEGLQEAAMQLERTDAAEIAKELDMTDRIVRSYLNGEVMSMETGKAILKSAKAIILKREREIKKLVA